MQISMKQSLASLVAEKAAIGCEYNTKKVLMSTYAVKNPSTATSANVMKRRLKYSTNQIYQKGKKTSAGGVLTKNGRSSTRVDL